MQRTAVAASSGEACFIISARRLARSASSSSGSLRPKFTPDNELIDLVVEAIQVKVKRGLGGDKRIELKTLI